MTTLMTQLLFGAIVCNEHVSVSAKSPVPLTAPISNGADPVLVTVTVCAWLAVPTGKLPKDSVAGEVASPGSVPCPLSVASVDTRPLASLTTSDPASVPIAVGVKLTLTAQDAAAAKMAGH